MNSELLKLGFIDQQQYLQAKEALANPNTVPHGALGLSGVDLVQANAQVATICDYSPVVYSNSLTYPNEADLTGSMPKVYSQGERGTCMAQAGVGLLEYYFENKYRLSQQFLYWALKHEDGMEQRLREWLTCSNLTDDDAFKQYLNFMMSTCPLEVIQSEGFLDLVINEYRETFAGSTIITLKNTIQKYGICEYDLMPYVISKDPQTEAQSPELFNVNLLNELMAEPKNNAIEHMVTDKLELISGRSIDAYKRVLSGADGKRPMPIVFAVKLYKSLDNDYTKTTGWVSLPLPKDDCKGGHAMLAVGYKDTPLVSGGGYLIVRNSWSENWAWDYRCKGYARIPYAYIQNFACSQALTIQCYEKPNTQSDDIDDCWFDDANKTTAEIDKYIKIAPKDMRNYKGRFCISKGQKIIVDPTSDKVDVDNENNRKTFILNGYKWNS